LKPECGHSPDRLADLVNNAQRRLDEGRYDDALARLYRSAEMLAQWVLSRDFGIDTAAVDLAKVPPSLRSALESARPASQNIQIGLDWDYRLLAALDHPAGHGFDQGELRGLGVLLKKRNVSLLAHGLEPIAKADVEAVMAKVQRLVSLVVPDFDARRAALEFPWRRSPRVSPSP
jgi:CRISPR-associated protein (TIGR02710 family)